MKSAKPRLSILTLSLAIVIALFAYLSFAAPFYAETSNTTSPASPATYAPTANYSFAINWTDVANTTFQLGIPAGTFTNYTVLTTPATTNISVTFRINFTQNQIGGAGAYNYTWFGTNETGAQNSTQTVGYTINKAVPVLTMSNTTNALNTSGLVLYMPFSEGSGASKTEDKSGWGNNGTLANMNTTGNSTSGWTSGKYGNALQFDGVDDYVDAGNAASLDVTTSATFEFWINTSIQNNRDILNHRDSTELASYRILLDPHLLSENRLVLTYGYGTNWGYMGNPGTVPIISPNVWHHVAITIDNISGTYYIDGILKQTHTLVGQITGNGKNLFLMGRSDYSKTSGTIDEVRIYNRSLSADEIKMQYNSSKYYPFAGNVSTSLDNAEQTVGLYRFENTSLASPFDSQILGAGQYWYIANASATQNYTKIETLLPFEILQNITKLIVSPQTQTITYGASILQYCSNNIDLLCSLYRNGSSIANNTNIVLGAAVYNYTANITDTANYTVWQNSSLLTINKAAISARLFLNGTEGNKNYNMTQIANFTVLLNISGKTVYLGTNLSGWSAASGASPLFNYTQLQQSGIFNITGYFIGDENYTASSVTYFANISAAIANITANLILHLGAAFADDSLQNGNGYGCVQDGSGWFGLTAENPAQAQSGNLTGDYNLNVSGTSDSKIYLAAGTGGCANFRRYAADAQLKRFLSPLMAFSYAKTNLIQLILQFNATDITNDAHWGKGTYLLSIANQGYSAISGKQSLAVKTVK